MPGLIDAHCHLSYGYPHIPRRHGRGITRPSWAVGEALERAKVLRAGVTSLRAGGTCFTDVCWRDAIKLGVMEGPRTLRGRKVLTMAARIPTSRLFVHPDRGIRNLCNSGPDVLSAGAVQHGVNFTRCLAPFGAVQASPGGNHGGRRRGPAVWRVAIHSAGRSDRAAAEAGSLNPTPNRDRGRVERSRVLHPIIRQ